MKPLKDTTLEELAQTMPPDVRQEVERYARSLMAERRGRRQRSTEEPRKLTNGWAGALSHLRDRYNSGVELQHEAMKLWEEAALDGVSSEAKDELSANRRREDREK